MIVIVVAVVVVAVVLAVVLAAVVVAVVKSATLEKHICEVDEERSGNVDIVVELIHCLIDCSLKHAYKKLIAAGWGLLIGGGVLLFVGGTPLKGGSLSELPKTAFFN